MKILFYWLVILFTCFEHGRSFQKSPLNNYQHLTQDLRSLVNETIFGDGALLLESCREEHPENISLDLSNLGINRIPNNFISSPYVTCLDLQNNKIQGTTLSDFQQQPNLEYLNLASNSFYLETFLNFTLHSKLKTLILDNTQSYRSNKDLVDIRLPNLEKLSLRKIYFYSSNDLSAFNYTLTNLTHLYLSDNNINSWKDEIFENLPTTLTHLFMERCYLNLYSASNNNQTASLISLSLDGNEFSCSHGGCLDFEIHPELKYLSIASCEISVISYNTFNYNSKLLYLDMSSNRIQEIPERLFLKTSALETLNLNDNQLLKIPNLRNLTKLKKLYINNNKITNLHQNSFSSFENLIILSLSQNDVSFIEDSVLDKLTNLMLLDLSHNKINSLVYRSPLNLRYLNLANNLFSSMNNIKLVDSALGCLNLTENPIESIKPMSLKFLPDNVTIVLKGGATCF